MKRMIGIIALCMALARPLPGHVQSFLDRQAEALHGLVVMKNSLTRSGSSTSYAPMPQEEMLEASDIVFAGELVGKSRAFIDEGGTVTNYYFSIAQIYKGSPDSGGIAVRMDGGSVGLDTYTADWVPKLENGAEYLLFLNERDGRYEPTLYDSSIFERNSQGYVSVRTRKQLELTLEPE